MSKYVFSNSDRLTKSYAAIFSSYRQALGFITAVLGLTYALSSLKQGWLGCALIGFVVCAIGLHLAFLDRRPEDVRVKAVVIPELKLRGIERQILFAYLGERPDHAALQ